VSDRAFVECPNKRGSLVNTGTGQVLPLTCQRNICPVCLPINASKLARELTCVRPEHHVRLSLPKVDRDHARRSMTTLRRIWRKEHGPWEDAYVIEPNLRGTGCHVHAWQWGSPVDQSTLRDAARRSRFLHEDVYAEPRHTPDGLPLWYTFKMVLGEPALALTEDAETFLELNGGRLVHTTRKFWRNCSRGGNPTSDSRTTGGTGGWVIIP
jgi:hypothetical protein